jgi:subtilase family serine protease
MKLRFGLEACSLQGARLTFAAALLLVANATLATAASAEETIVAGTLDGVRDRGPAPGTVSVRVAVVLANHHEDELERLTEAQGDPSSPLYHRFLSREQFHAYFAPTLAEYASVVRSLARGGFTIAATAPNLGVVDAVAPAPIAARYFSTDIHRVLSPELGLTYENVRAGAVPSAIAGLVQAVVGLDATAVFRLPHRIQPSPLSPAERPARRDGSPLFGPGGTYGPMIFAAAYDLPTGQGAVGTGRVAGIEMDGDFENSDLAAYLAYFGITRTGPPITRIAVDGGAKPFPGGDAAETTGDVETIASLAPGAGLYVYEFPALDATYLIDMYNRVVSDNIVDTLNSSWYGCERQDHGQFARALEGITVQGAVEGITFHSSSGDRGAYTPLCRRISVAVPASTPHNIAVGGTSLFVDANGNETSEVGWDVPGAGATGGGVSVVFKRPPYQRDVPNAIASGRNVPDVAFDAGCSTPTAWYFDGSWSSFCGTSLASPIFGALLTAVNQIEGSRAGYFNVTLYRTWLANGYSNESTAYFRDITQGSIPPYYAQQGYDQMTGIGAMQSANFASLLAGTRAPRSRRRQDGALSPPGHRDGTTKSEGVYFQK